MKSSKENGDAVRDEASIDIEALLTAIDEICASEIQRSADDPYHVSIDGREFHSWRELAEAFELDVHDFRISEINR